MQLCALLVAYHGPTFLQRLTRGRDVSYGIYLWAFPVQQTTALVWAGITPFAMIALALAVTSLLAVASWTLIEPPALRLKSFGLPRSPTVQRIPAPVISCGDRPAAAITASAPEHRRKWVVAGYAAPSRHDGGSLAGVRVTPSLNGSAALLTTQAQLTLGARCCPSDPALR